MNTSKLNSFLSAAIIIMLLAGCADKKESPRHAGLPSKTNLEAFSDLKFGMFIHWGLYAIPAGEWKDHYVRGIGEWIMKVEQIPAAEYAMLANQFNPVEFNADEWAQLAQDAGMKYMVITSKHHDGFAMFRSKASEYNIVDATPFGRDPMAELAEATAKRNIDFGFYYSQSQDWYEPNAAGNTWDFPEKRDPLPYLENKVFPQVEELLTNYGKMALVWFDTPMLLTKEQVVDLKKLVKKYQPDCLVNDRIGYGQGDYFQMGDNSTPPFVYDWNVWEVPATLNDTWGYKKNDQNWKKPGDLIYKLTDIVSKGGNYLLNVGPDARGVIPLESQDILRKMGKWLSVNGDAIYGTSHSPLFMPGTSWKCTVKPWKMFIHVFNYSNGELRFRGLESEIEKAYLLKDGKKIKYRQKGNEVVLNIPDSQVSEYNTVVVLELRDEVPVITEGFRYNDSQQEYSMFAIDARILGEEIKVLNEQNAVSGFFESQSFPPNELWWFHYPYKSGKFKVSVEYSCDDSIAGSPFAIVKDYDPYNGVKADSLFVNEELKGTIRGTGGEFKVFETGEIMLYEKNLNRITFRLKDDFRSSGVRFRRIILRPVI